MRTLQNVAFIASEVNRDREIALGEKVRAWREAQANGLTDPRIERQGQNAAVALAEANQRYLPNILKKYYTYASIEIDELWTTGFLGLVQAAKAYEPTKGYFWHFAKKFVHGEIQDLLRKNYAVILPKDKFAKAQKDPALKALLSTASIQEEVLGEQEGDSEYRPDERSLLNAAIASLSPEQQEIIRRLHGIGCHKDTLAILAQERGVSITTIGNYRKSAERAIKEYLENPPLETICEAEESPIEAVAAISELEEEEPAKIVEVEQSELQAVEETPQIELTEKLTEVEKALNRDTIGLSILGSAMRCLYCTAHIPTPPEGIATTTCVLCFARYECDRNGLLTPVKRSATDAPIVYKDQSLDIPPMSEKEHRRHEALRIATLNDLAGIYEELEARGAPFDGVRTRVLNLWRETTEYRLFDESAMERVGVWIEEVENVSN